MSRYKIIIQYDGSKYNGWQLQPNVITIQGVLETGIRKVFRNNDKFTSKMLSIIKFSPLVPLFGSGSYKIQPVYIEDISKACEEIIFKPKKGNKNSVSILPIF